MGFAKYDEDDRHKIHERLYGKYPIDYKGRRPSYKLGDKISVPYSKPAVVDGKVEIYFGYSTINNSSMNRKVMDIEVPDITKKQVDISLHMDENYAFEVDVANKCVLIEDFDFTYGIGIESKSK